MRARVRLSFPTSPIVLQLSHQDNSWHWWALHYGQLDWGVIFSSVLRLLDIEVTEFPQRLQLHDDKGEVTWHRRWCCTTIHVRLLKFSERKQKLVAAALLKAARHSKPKEHYANSK
jgi:hypothetical protein